MNGIKCDECMAGYKTVDIKDCTQCLGEFCDVCIANHTC